jgi:aryl-phospho-beta-D-glucosidase BglC (GH1 family)
MRDWGFDFVRIPIAYPTYINFDRSRHIKPEEVYHIDEAAIEKIESLVAMAHKHHLHVSLNLHRAPGYCINAGFHEPFNLWKDEAAIADGNNVGNTVIPEIIDLDIAQSCRGYNPGLISHYKAPWANKDPENMPEPKWPGQVGDRYLSREMLEKYYQPWTELAKSGVGVHCGECGCWNKTPHAVFLAWFSDVLDILSSNKIGYALWNFVGSFGLLNPERADVQYEDWYGYKLDKKLLDLLRKT